METKINIAAILKDKPQGTKLYDWLHNIDVELDTISTTDTETVVWCTNETNNNTTCHRGYSEFGTERGYPEGLQILLPSKEMRDWAKFSWKKGDVLVSKDNVYIIFEKFEDDTYTRFKGKHYLWKEFNVEDYNKEETKMLTSVFEKATDDVAQTYIKTIEEHLDGKLNFETLEIEKQTEFKDGDVVVTDAVSSLYYSKCIFILKGDFNTGEVCANSYIFYNIDNNDFCFDVLDTEIRDRNIHLATEEEKLILFDALAKKGKAWDAEKKLVVDLKTKCEFKPFDKVLGRNEKDDVWEAELFSHYREESQYPFRCIGFSRKYCIPYNEKTAHLLGTTDNWEGDEQ